MTGADINALLDAEIARCKDLLQIKDEFTALGLDTRGVVAALARVFEFPDVDGSTKNTLDNVNTRDCENIQRVDVENIAQASSSLNDSDTALLDFDNRLANARKLSGGLAIPESSIPKPAEVWQRQSLGENRGIISVPLGVSSSGDDSNFDRASTIDEDSGSDYKSEDVTDDSPTNSHLLMIPALNPNLKRSGPRSSTRGRILLQYSLKSVHLEGSRYKSLVDSLHYSINFDEKSEKWFVQEVDVSKSTRCRDLVYLPPALPFRVFRTKANGRILFRSHTIHMEVGIELFSSEYAVDLLRHIRHSRVFHTCVLDE
ncbi:hypothetical protein MMC07_001975 [Pseudocyphellaria aurata]|nr:hypothetical protein [Pseudocyphellaria aurata]